MSSIEATVTASQRRWTGHNFIIRMNDSRLPKAVFYGEFAKGKRLSGGQRLRYKDVVKLHLKATYITADHWETLAQEWRQAIHKGLTLSAPIIFVSTAGEALNLKLVYSLTNEQST